MKFRSKAMASQAAEYLCVILLGWFSLFFILRYGDIPPQFRESRFMPRLFAAVTVLFAGLWTSLKYFYGKMRMGDIRKLVLSAAAVFAVNYLLFVFTKLVLGVHSPLSIARTGLTALAVLWLFEMVVLGLLTNNYSYKERMRLLNEKMQLEESLARRQYQALQSQLNPHFLFNTLNTLIAEIEFDPASAAQFARNMSDIYRYVLRCQDQRLSPLGEELKFLETYFSLHRVRLGGGLEAEVSDEAAASEASVPSLTLQLLAENIIKHNVISPSRPMKVRIFLKDGYLCVSNPVCRKRGAVSSGKGLENLSGRCRLLGGTDVRVEESDGVFTVEVPLFYE